MKHHAPTFVVTGAILLAVCCQTITAARHLATSTSAHWAQVAGERSDFNFTGTTRRHFIQAEEVIWDYAPNKLNDVTGHRFDEHSRVYVTTGPGRIGSRYLKCLYRGYTDEKFSTRLPLRKREAYLSFQGPVLRAEVGDKMRVVFRNRCSIPATIHTHGVRYNKRDEGAPYADNTTRAFKTDDTVPPGGMYVYDWIVPEQAGPGPADGSSVMWMYHSHRDEIGDTYAGLMGSMVITARGMANPDGSPKDVDHEVFELWSVMNENNSPYLEENLKRFALAPKPDSLLEDEDFEESNLMHSVNGYVFANQPMIVLCRGERVRWYNVGMGTEVDLHTPHWHGNVLLVGGHRMDTINLLPATMIVADMVPYNHGTWLHHCHVNDHIAAGMLALYRVVHCSK